ncbi:TolC family protein [uncultured Pontibacter sp.]|uniref:TolC family protein n=1 Tax=uncultured Pontibacter sp. TaxID=453356 RepID=UPI00260CF4E0|nr:TolC family protein [uncultured Pontibacter sp.]
MLVNVHKHNIFLLLLVAALAFPAKAQVWTLQQSIDTAMVNNRNLQIGRNTTAISQYKHQEARANLIPKLHANADYRYYTNLPYQLMPMSVFGGQEGQFKEAQFGVPHNINANVQLTMPLYNSQVQGAIKTTEIASELTALQYRKTEERVYLEVANLYYNAQILKNQLAFIDSNLVNSLQLLKNMQLLKEQLLAKGSDVNKVALQTEQLATQRELINSNYEQVLNALKFTMGLSLATELDIDPSISYHTETAYTETLTTDVQVAQVQTKLHSSELTTLQRSKLPSLSLYGTYGTTGFGYDQSPNNFLKFYPIGFAGVQLSLPLFNGTVTQQKISQKKLELANSELQLREQTEQNSMQVENARKQRQVAQQTVTNNLSQIELAKSVYEQTLLQQKHGVASLTDVLLADNTLREAQQNYLSAMVNYLKADLELKHLTGNILNSKP